MRLTNFLIYSVRRIPLAVTFIEINGKSVWLTEAFGRTSNESCQDRNVATALADLFLNVQLPGCQLYSCCCYLMSR